MRTASSGVSLILSASTIWRVTIVLDGEDVGEVAVVALRPQVPAI